MLDSKLNHSLQPNVRFNVHTNAQATWRQCSQMKYFGRRNARSRPSSRSVAVFASSTSFHQSRLSAAGSEDANKLPPLQVDTRLGARDDELEAAAWLRSKSFYAYPPERKFAGELHQIMMAEEELKALKAQRLSQHLDQGKEGSTERSACLLATIPKNTLLQQQQKPTDTNNNTEEEALEIEDVLVFTDDGENDLVLVGTLDLCAVRSLDGEVLLGDSKNPAYLANVCTATVARRRNVGGVLITAARELARSWGVDGLYVHTMAVNEIALKFYERNGFVIEKEETSNQAHYRGRCLDGIEGRGRTVLLRDTLL